MISGVVTGDKEVARYFRALPDGIRSRVSDSIGRLTLALQRSVKRDKLSGQVLKVRTGLLRRTIGERVVTDGSTISGIVSSNLEYTKIHEYGSHETVTVKEHLRLVKVAFGKELKSPVWSTVKAHPMKLNMPERSFLRTALADMKEDIIKTLDKAAGEGVKK